MREPAWSKVEERHFKSAYAKHKDDVGGIQFCVKTRTFGEVVRLFFVEDGMRKKAERERKRELELLKAARSHGGGGAGLAAAALGAPGEPVRDPAPWRL